MKNNSVYIAVAALIAAAGAAVYGVLFSLGIIPTAMPFAVSGVIISFAVLVMITFAAIKWKTKNRYALYTSFTILGKWLITAAIICFCVSVLVLSLSPAIIPLYTAILIILIFFWKFTLLLWGFILFGAVPSDCCSTNEAAEAQTYTDIKNCHNNCGSCRY